MGRRRLVCLRAVGALLAALALVAALPSAAVGERKQEVTFEFFGWEIVDDRHVTDRGQNVTAVSWHFQVLVAGSSDFSICCDAALDPLEWVWNTKTTSGTVSGTWQSHHFFLPVSWDGRLSGRMSEAGGEGIIHLTELNSGAKFHGTWTSPPVDPLGEGFAGLNPWTVTGSGTVG
jgi:hypothetical protein